MVDQAALKTTVHDRFLIPQEGFHAFVFQLSDHRGPHVDDLLVVVCDLLIDDPLLDMLTDLLVEEAQ